MMMRALHPIHHRLPRRVIGALAALLLIVPLLHAQDGEQPAEQEVTAIPSFRAATTIAVLTVHGEIDLMTIRSLERRIETARDDGCDAIVLDLDTPGGRLDVTLDICSLLKDRGATPVNTVAWIHPNAYSAGSVIALACREIVASSNASFGDAAPIQAMGGMMQQINPTERAKIEAPLLAEVIDSARRHHYDENLVQALISVGIELWMLEHVRTGERIFVDRVEFEAIYGKAPAESITNVTPRGAGRGVSPRFDTTVPRDLASGVGEEDDIRAQIEFQQFLPPARSTLSGDDIDDWIPIGQVISDDRLLTVKTGELIHYGLAIQAIDTDQQLMKFFGATSIRRYDRNWSESLVAFLISWPVRIILIVILLVCGFIEMVVPGNGPFGVAAAGALLVLIGAPALAGMAQWWDVLLIGVGLLLVAAELFIIPGFGVAGIAGAICLLCGLVGTFISGDIASPEGQNEMWTGVLSVFTALFTSGVAFWLISRQLHNIPVLNKLVLRAEIGGTGIAGEGTYGAVGAMRPPGRADVEVGDEGIARTDLRPAGRAEINGRLLDVQAPGRYIEEGAPIRVSRVGRFEIEVEEHRA